MLTLCLDIGGTKIAAGLADPGGALVHTVKRPTPIAEGRAGGGVEFNSAERVGRHFRNYIGESIDSLRAGGLKPRGRVFGGQM